MLFAIHKYFVVALAALANASVLPRAAASTPQPPGLQYLFTATIQLGQPLQPIPIPGGYRTTVPVLSNSTVSGPAVNGSILGGLAYPSLYNNLTLEFLEIDIYGRTADGYSFYVHESGVQPGAKKGFSRLTIDVAGPYSYLNTSFVVTKIEDVGPSTVVADAFRLV